MLAAVALVGILVIPILSMFMGSAISVLLAGEETKAVTLAQEGMEILKGRGFASLKNDLQGQEKLFWSETWEGYEREAEFRCLPLADYFPAAEGEVIFLQVSVFWGKGDKRRSVSLVSLLGEDGGEVAGEP